MRYISFKIKEFSRFIFWGAFNTLLGYVIYIFLLTFFAYPVSYTLTYVSGIFISYYLNTRFVFKEKVCLKKAIKYPLVYIIQYISGIILLYFLVEIFAISKLLAPILVVLLTLPVTYLLSKLIIKGGKKWMSVKDCVIIELPKVTDLRGNLTFIEGNRNVPFEIKRVFYLYDVPTGESRGAHAHKKLQQVLICLSGSFDVAVDDGFNKSIIHLNRPWTGLYIPPMIWASEINFDSGTVCLVLASEPYDESDYYRDYQEFKKAVNQQ